MASAREARFHAGRPPRPEQEDGEHFNVLAEAIAGRRVGVVLDDVDAAWTDGELIHLPRDAADPGAALVVQAGLLAAGSLDSRVVLRLAGQRRIRQRYLTLEALRCAALLEHVMPPRVTRDLAGVFDGAPSADATDSLRRAGSREAVPEAPAWLGTIRPITLLRADPLGTGAPPSVDQRGGTDDKTLLREVDEHEDAEESRILKLLAAPGRNPFAAMVQKFLDMGRSPGEDGAGGDEVPTGGHSVGPVGPQAQESHTPAEVDLTLTAAPVGRRYPEWDHRRQAYRPNWCHVAEFDPAPRPDQPASADVRDPKLMRELARLGLAPERHRRQAEGDTLDMTALVEFVTARAAGEQGDPRVYETKRRSAQDLGVLVLLDATGSAAEGEAGQQVFDEHRVVAARLTAALEDLGDRVATYGFYSRGREAVRFLRVKDFDGRFDYAAQRRLAALEPAGFTRLGAAVRHATHLLRTDAGTQSTLLVLVGDGHPYDDGYEQRHAQQDSRRSLSEAVRAGVGCACVSVRPTTDEDVMRNVWGHVPSRRLAHADQLAGQIRPLFRDALRDAAASRRSVGSPHSLPRPKED